MLVRIGLLLGLAAVFLQIAVFLQPLLPKQYQISPVCETITQALLVPNSDHSSLASSHPQLHRHHLEEKKVVISHDHHDVNHQCQYCAVYGHLLLPPEIEVQEVLVRIQVRLLAFKQFFQHVYFELQRLFLIPQGRAPPCVT